MITATLAMPPNLDAALRGLKPSEMLRIVRRGMDRGTQAVSTAIQRNRLSGKGPYAVAANRLGVGQSKNGGRLRKSLRPTPAQVTADAVTTMIGSKVHYAAAHEFGFKGKVPVPAHSRTIKKAFGKKLKAASTHTVKAHQRLVNIPERRPIRTGIEENRPLIINEIIREVQTTFA